MKNSNESSLDRLRNQVSEVFRLIRLLIAILERIKRKQVHSLCESSVHPTDGPCDCAQKHADDGLNAMALLFDNCERASR